jgi:hypothetical protein
VMMSVMLDWSDAGGPNAHRGEPFRP